MTVREELLYEISQAPEKLLRSPLTLICQEKKTQHVTRTIEEKQHLLRGIPLTIPDDFDDPMPELWDALGQ